MNFNFFQKATDMVVNKLKNKLYRSMYEFQSFSGTVNVMQDDTSVYLSEGYGNTDIYSIIGKQNSMRKQARLKLMKRLPDGTEEEVVKDHDLLKFKKKVNPDMQTDEFIDLFHIFRPTCGEHFSYRIQQSGSNKTLEFYAMPSDDVDIIEDGWMSRIRGYKLSESYGNIEFDTEEVVQSRMANPYFANGTYHGLSPIRANRATLVKQNEALSTQAKQFQNQGPDTIVYRDSVQNSQGGPQNRFNDEQRSEIEKQVKNHTKKKGNKLPLVLKEKFGVLKLGSSITDLDILESTKDGLVKFCNMLQMPGILFGLPSTFNNMSEARKAAWTDSIIPSNKALTDHLDALTINDVSEYSDLFWAYDYGNVEELQMGMKAKVDWMNAGHWPVNDILEATGHARIDNPILDEPQIPQGITFPSELGLIDEQNTTEE